jgi:WD40 repeat protein
MQKTRTSLPSPPLPSFVLRSFSSGISSVKYDSIDVDRLYAADQQGSIHLFNLRTRMPIVSISNAHESTVLGLSQWNDQHDQFITLGKDGFVKHWNAHVQCQWSYQTNHCSFSNCDTIGSNLIVAPIGSEQSGVVALDIHSAKPIVKTFLPMTKETKCGMVMKLRVLDTNHLCVAYENGSIIIYDISTAKSIDSYQVTSDHEPVTTIDIFERTCLCGTTKSDLISLDLVSLKLQPTSTFRSVEMPNAGTSAIRCRPNDGKLVAVAGWDSRIRLFRRETGKQLAMLDLHRQQINAIDFNYHTQQMACASEDRTISIWDIYNENHRSNQREKTT